MFVSPSGHRRRPRPQPSPELLALAKAIRQARRAKDLSQEALAARADVHPKHLSEIERANKDPRATTLIRLAEALDLTPAELYRASEARPGADDGQPASGSATLDGSSRPSP
jgi:transcriptional regulator with XRE-family HTH domain